MDPSANVSRPATICRGEVCAYCAHVEVKRGGTVAEVRDLKGREREREGNVKRLRRIPGLQGEPGVCFLAVVYRSKRVLIKCSDAIQHPSDVNLAERNIFSILDATVFSEKSPSIKKTFQLNFSMDGFHFWSNQ